MTKMVKYFSKYKFLKICYRKYRLLVKNAKKHRISEKTYLNIHDKPLLRFLVFNTILMIGSKFFRSYDLSINRVYRLFCESNDSFNLQMSIKLNRDIKISYIAFGFTPHEYFLFELFSMPEIKRKEFISDQHRDVYCSKLNSREYSKYFTNKFKTYQKFSEFYGRNAMIIDHDSSFEIFQKFVTHLDSFVLKPIKGSMGRGIRLIEVSDHNPNSLCKLYSIILAEKPVILEERIQQCSELAALHPTSVNTIRVTTVYNCNKMEVFYPFLKIGRANAFVDNGGAGGILAGINKDTGIVSTNGVDEFGNRFDVHPDTGIQIKNFIIPRWEECIELVEKLVKVLPEMGYIGWDLSLTDKGWVMVEGNNYGQFVGQQLPYLTGRKKEFQRILKEFDQYWMYW